MYRQPSAGHRPLSDEDEVTLHLQDTLSAGDGLCNAAAVKILLEEGPQRIDELMAWGKSHGTPLVFGLESPHSRHRSLHSQADSTGREILRALHAKARSLKHISIAPFAFATALLTDGGRITGVALLDEKGVPQDVACSAVLLATGGMGQLYRNTTNPEAATADSVALAYRAGAELSDMEFVQFHPTALYMKKVPRFLLSEALRAEGAYLRNIELDRFMGKYHPMGERAPRDLVARAIVHEMEVSRAKDPFVYLDLTHLSASKVQKRFPRIYATCMEHNVDITEDVIPVRPAAHFCMGGVRTDLDGKTNVAGLYAAGEAAATGVHGANRLPSNSLLEGLVFGARAGKAMRDELKSAHASQCAPEGCVLQRSGRRGHGRTDRDKFRTMWKLKSASYARAWACRKRSRRWKRWPQGWRIPRRGERTRRRTCIGRAAGGAIGFGARGEPRGTLPHGISRSRRQEIL